MSMLPILHGMPSEDPYRHIEKLSQVCEVNQIQNVSIDVPNLAIVRDRAKDWFLKLGKEFTT